MLPAFSTWDIVLKFNQNHYSNVSSGICHILLLNFRTQINYVHKSESTVVILEFKFQFRR